MSWFGSMILTLMLSTCPRLHQQTCNLSEMTYCDLSVWNQTYKSDKSDKSGQTFSTMVSEIRHSSHSVTQSFKSFKSFS